MNYKRKKSTDVIKLFTVFLCVTVIMFVLNYLTPLYFDDYRYSFSFATGERMTSLSQIIPSMIAHHKVMNGRIVVHTLAQAFLMMNHNLFDIINSVAFAGLILVVYYHSTGTLKNFKVWLYALIFLDFWLFLPSFGGSFFWLTGSANYLFGPLIGLLFLVPYTRYNKNPQKTKNNLYSVIGSVVYLLFGMIAGCTNENLSLCLFGIQVLFVIAFVVSRIQLKLWMFAGIAGNVIGTVVLFSSPSYAKRSAIWSGQSSLFSMLRGFFLNCTTFFEYFMVVIIALCLIIICLSARKKGLTFKEISVPAIFSLALLAYIGSTIACDYFPETAWVAGFIFLVITSVRLLLLLDLPTPPRVVAVMVSAVIAVSFVSGSFTEAFLAVKSVDYAFDEREKLIVQTLESGENTIELSAIESNNKYCCYTSGGDLQPGKWMWDSIARYYGLAEVMSKENVE